MIDAANQSAAGEAGSIGQKKGEINDVNAAVAAFFLSLPLGLSVPPFSLGSSVPPFSLPFYHPPLLFPPPPLLSFSDCIETLPLAMARVCPQSSQVHSAAMLHLLELGTVSCDHVLCH